LAFSLKKKDHSHLEAVENAFIFVLKTLENTLNLGYILIESKVCFLLSTFLALLKSFEFPHQLWKGRAGLLYTI